MLGLLIAQAAISIENAKLYSLLQDALEKTRSRRTKPSVA